MACIRHQAQIVFHSLSFIFNGHIRVKIGLRIHHLSTTRLKGSFQLSVFQSFKQQILLIFQSQSIFSTLQLSLFSEVIQF